MSEQLFLPLKLLFGTSYEKWKTSPRTDRPYEEHTRGVCTSDYYPGSPPL